MKNKKYIVGIILLLLVISSYFWSGTEDKNTTALETTTIEATTQGVEPSSEVTTTEATTIETTVVSTAVLETKTQGNEQVTSLEPTTEVATAPIITSNDEKTQCTLSINCDKVLDNMDKLTEGKAEIIPANGIILSPYTLDFTEGESVFDVLLRATKDNNIHFEFSSTPAYKTAYIEGINNLYEFDCGELSGWMYKVNGEFPRYGCSQYELKNGDVIEFVYSCDLGRDVGDEYIGG